MKITTIKTLYFILLLIFLLSCEKEYKCLECHERYYIDLFILKEFWDTTYVYCDEDENLLEFSDTWYTTDTKGYFIHPLARTRVIRNCEGK